MDMIRFNLIFSLLINIYLSFFLKYILVNILGEGVKTLFDLEKEGRELATRIQHDEGRKTISISPSENLSQLIDKIRSLVLDLKAVVEEFLMDYRRYDDANLVEKSFNRILDLLDKLAGRYKYIVSVSPSDVDVIKSILDEINILINHVGEFIRIIESSANAGYFPDNIKYIMGGLKKLRQDVGLMVNKYDTVKQMINKIAEQLHKNNRWIRKVLAKPSPHIMSEVSKYLNDICVNMNYLVDKVLRNYLVMFQLRFGSKYPIISKYYEKLSGREKKIANILVANDIIYNLCRYLLSLIKINDFSRGRGFNYPNKVNVVQGRLCMYTLFGEYKDCSIRDVFKLLEKFLGRKVGYLVHYMDELSWSALINDVANAVHILAEELEKLGVSSSYGTVGKCIIVEENPSERLVKLCRLWSEYVENNRSAGMYIDSDYHALSGYIMGNRVSLRVGSSTSHATHIELRNNELYIRYYDYDRNVNTEMKKLFEQCGCSCKLLRDGVECTCRYTGEQQLDCLARAISLATSMDIRLSE